MRVTPAIVVAVTATFGLAACGGGGDDNKKSEARPTVDNVRQDASLVRPGSAGRAVVSFWENTQLGAVPVAVLTYAPEVRQDVGVQDLAGTLAAQQGNIMNTTPIVRQVRQTRLGPLVVMRAVRKEGTSPDYAFLLRRRRSAWVITYDSFTASSLRSYVASRTQSPGRNQAQAASRAAEAGEAATQRFRSASLSAPIASR